MTARVLVVDDDPDVRDVVAFQVELLGFEASAAGSVDEALALLADGGTDVLLTDVHLGEQDCRPLLRACRDAGTPAIVLTAADPASLLDLADVPSLQKPTSLDDLREAVAGALARPQPPGSAGD